MSEEREDRVDATGEHPAAAPGTPEPAPAGTPATPEFPGTGSAAETPVVPETSGTAATTGNAASATSDAGSTATGGTARAAASATSEAGSAANPGTGEATRLWGGRPPGGGKAFVVTHRPPPPDWSAENLAPFTFVGDVADAIERAKAAGDGNVGVSGPDIARQCLRLGLLDEVRIDLVPVFLGEGVRYFDDLGATGAELERVEVVAGEGVTHLRYRVHYRS
ncbi:dihydrofolate reductase family protein [Amycolatopsis solani]|uniref:dihydrofolate reductase family protein n=1 Tax=Amycolatopsis solani TaxID=3028615 RepID=UPI0025AED2AD|nr:dihydrofolate reductase family protein [Amycolatopsis sp. MEP2-6]